MRTFVECIVRYYFGCQILEISLKWLLLMYWLLVLCHRDPIFVIGWAKAYFNHLKLQKWPTDKHIYWKRVLLMNNTNPQLEGITTLISKPSYEMHNYFFDMLKTFVIYWKSRLALSEGAAVFYYTMTLHEF